MRIIERITGEHRYQQEVIYAFVSRYVAGEIPEDTLREAAILHHITKKDLYNFAQARLKGDVLTDYINSLGDIDSTTSSSKGLVDLAKIFKTTKEQARDIQSV